MDLYRLVTERIIEKLEQGTIPWQKPWRSIGAQRNLVSKKFYCGINVWLLTAQRYSSPYRATIRQINELAASVRKGEKATPVVFWRIYVDGVEVKAGVSQPEFQETEWKGKRRFVLRYYSVFNTEQCDLPATITEKLALPELRELDPIDACERFLPLCQPARDCARWRQGFLFAADRSGYDAAAGIVRERSGMVTLIASSPLLE